MTTKTDAQVTIGGKTYTLSGYEGEEYLQRVALYLNHKIEELRGDEDFKRLPLDTRNVLLNLNIADDYFKAMAEIEQLQAAVERSKSDLNEMKHDFVAVQMRLESAEKQIQNMTEKKA